MTRKPRDLRKPFIARDTGEPLVVLGGYPIAQDGSVLPQPLPTRQPGQDYGCDPLGDGRYRMVPSSDIVDYEERCRRLS